MQPATKVLNFLSVVVLIAGLAVQLYHKTVHGWLVLLMLLILVGMGITNALDKIENSDEQGAKEDETNGSND